MADDGNTLVKFQIERLDNNTFLATLVTQANSSLLHSGSQAYDDEGALYYVVAVVFIYGFSIILMIGSLIKRNKGDNGVSKYMKDMDKVRRMERRQKKYQTRLAMSAAGGSRRASRALAARGCNVDLGPYSAPPAAMLGDSTFNWDNSSAEQGGDVGTTLGTLSSTSLVVNPPDGVSNRMPLLGWPPPGRAVPVLVPVSPRGPRHGTISHDGTSKDDVSAGDVSTEDVKLEGVSSLTSYPDAEGDTEGQCSTMLYIENEKEGKCKVSIVQAQLGTVHEEDEEHVVGQDVAGVPVVNV